MSETNETRSPETATSQSYARTRTIIGSCLHCGKPVFKDDRSRVQIEYQEPQNGIGYMHETCHRQSTAKGNELKPLDPDRWIDPEDR